MMSLQYYAAVRGHFNEHLSIDCPEIPDMNFRVCIPIDLSSLAPKNSAEMLEWEQNGLQCCQPVSTDVNTMGLTVNVSNQFQLNGSLLRSKVR